MLENYAGKLEKSYDVLANLAAEIESGTCPKTQQPFGRTCIICEQPCFCLELYTC